LSLDSMMGRSPHHRAQAPFAEPRIGAFHHALLEKHAKTSALRRWHAFRSFA